MDVLFVYRDIEFCWTLDWEGKNKIHVIASPQDEFEWTDSMDEKQFLSALDNLKI